MTELEEILKVRAEQLEEKLKVVRQRKIESFKRECEKKLREMQREGASRKDQFGFFAAVSLDLLKDVAEHEKKANEVAKSLFRTLQERGQVMKEMLHIAKAREKRPIPKDLKKRDMELFLEKLKLDRELHRHEFWADFFAEQNEIVEEFLIRIYPKIAPMLGKTAVERGENGKTRITVPKGTKKVKVRL